MIPPVFRRSILFTALVLLPGAHSIRMGTPAAAESSGDAAAVAFAGQPAGSKPTATVADAKGTSEWPFLPDTSGKGPDEAFLVTSITFEGLDAVGMTEQDISGAPIDIDDRGRAWGRPIENTVRLGALLHPVSPLCLYHKELGRICQSVVKLINDKGFVGIYVGLRGPQHLVDGAVRVSVQVARVAEIRVKDQRAFRTHDGDEEVIRAACPIKPGDPLIRARLEETTRLLETRLHSSVDIAVEAQGGDDPDRVLLTIIIGTKKGE